MDEEKRLKMVKDPYSGLAYPQDQLNEIISKRRSLRSLLTSYEKEFKENREKWNICYRKARALLADKKGAKAQDRVSLAKELYYAAEGEKA